MIKTINLNKMYDEFIDNDILTAEKLIECGFEFNDIIKLIKNDYLIQLGNNNYTLKKVEDLYLYGNKLIKVDEHKARKCFEKCYELEPNNKDACFQLFFYSIKDKKYEKAFEYLKVMLKNSDEYEIKDNNLYLYLLNVIIELPKEYKRKAKNITFCDVRLLDDDIRYDDVMAQNYVRNIALDNKFFYAVEKLRETTTFFEFTFRDKILKMLLFEAGDIEKLRKNKVLELVKNRKYDELILHYKKLQQRCNLKKNDKYILDLVREIINVENTLELPIKVKANTNTLFEAIRTKNYRRALSLSEEYITDNNLSSITFYLLLSDLCEKMSVISILNAIFEGMAKYVENKDYVSLVKRVKNYLESIDKKEYEDLVIDYIKLDLYENNLGFNKTIKLLYRIITNSNNLDKSYCLEDVTQNQETIALDSAIDKSIIRSKEEEYISNKHSQLLRNKGIIVLEPMSDSKIKLICDIADNYTDMKPFIIGNDKNKRVVLRYKYRTEKIVNYDRIKRCAEQAYLNGEYDICLSYYLQLLQYGNPKNKTYARIGQCYLMLGQPMMAVDYLMVATELSKLSHNEYDFTDEINEIKRSQSSIRSRFKKLVLSIGLKKGD